MCGIFLVLRGKLNTNFSDRGNEKFPEFEIRDLGSAIWFRT